MNEKWYYPADSKELSQDCADWRAALTGVFDVAGSLDQFACFRGSLSFVSSPRFAIAWVRSSPLTFLPASEDRLDLYGLLLAPRGGIEFRVGSIGQPMGRGCLLFFDLAQEFELRFCDVSDPAEIVILWISRARLQSLIARSSLIHGAALSENSAAGAILGSTMENLSRHAERLRAAEMDALIIGYVEMAGRGLNSMLREISGALVAEPLASLVSVRNFIDQNLGSPKLNIDFIARTFGMSRVTLFRLFTPLGGVATYIRRQRLERAYQQITSPRLANKRIAYIAHQLGFTSMATFNRLFLAAFGESPSNARARARGRDGSAYLWTGEKEAKGQLWRQLQALRRI